MIKAVYNKCSLVQLNILISKPPTSYLICDSTTQHSENTVTHADHFLHNLQAWGSFCCHHWNWIDASHSCIKRAWWECVMCVTWFIEAFKLTCWSLVGVICDRRVMLIQSRKPSVIMLQCWHRWLTSVLIITSSSLDVIRTWHYDFQTVKTLQELSYRNLKLPASAVDLTVNCSCMVAWLQYFVSDTIDPTLDPIPVEILLMLSDVNSTVHHCSNVSKNRFDLVSTIGQTFGHPTWH